MEFSSIIISGLPCSGKTTLIERLSKNLDDWKIKSIGKKWRDKWRETYPNGEVSFEEYWRNTGHEENFAVNVEARKEIAEGNIIYDSRYSALYCQDLAALRVFITAPLDVRTLRATQKPEYRVKTFEGVKTILIMREDDEFKRGLDLFGKDYRAKSHYDLVLDSNEDTIDQELSQILAAQNGSKP